MAPVARLRAVVLIIGILGVALDQITKAMAVANLDPLVPVPLIGDLLVLRLIRNPGAAFSMGEGLTPVITVVAIAATGGVLGWLLPRVRHLGWAITTGMLLAGILGNLIDRLFQPPGVFRGHVIDFFQVPFFIFNVADVFITAAAVMVLWLTLITQVGLDGASLNEKQAKQ